MNELSNYAPDIQDVILHTLKNTEDGFKPLSSIIPKELIDKALSIVENERIVVLQGVPSGRIYYMIKGTNPIYHPDLICFKHYCPCSGFQESIQCNTELYICHHILAILIAIHRKSVLPVEKKNDKELLFRVR